MQENTFLKGKILPPLIKFALPLMLSQLLQALYGAVDLIVVGHYGTTADFSAVATASQLMQGITGIIIGLTTGVTVLIGQAIGSGNNKRAGDISAGMTKLLIVISLIFFAVLTLFAPEALDLLKIPSAAKVAGTVYIRICAAGVIFISAYNAISGLFRGVGNSKMPLIFILVACIVNIIGDILLVGVFKMGAAGAALATVLAQTVSVIFSVIYILKGGLPFKITKESFKARGAVGRILKTGVPIALQDFLTRVSFLILTAILNSLGLVASASIGISEKLFLFLSIIPISFMSALSAFVAQNIGAGNRERAYKSLKISVGISFVFGILTFIATFFFPEILAAAFEKNPEVIAAAARYQRGCAAEHLFISVFFCMLGYFNGLGKTDFVMFQGIFTAFAVRIPLSYLLSRGASPDLFKIGLAVPASALVSFLLCLIYLIYLNKKEKSKLRS
ncbi:MAG: MATE family efflux transporter [Acutalibacteraceae bacterium]